MSPTTTLIAAARNEGPFLLEWVAYHRAIGFDHIVILSDTSHDKTEALLDKLATTRAITHIPKADQPEITATGFHNRAYTHALGLPVVQDADWVMALDIDEYLNIHVGNGKLRDLLGAMHKRGRTDVICASSRSFGNAGQAGFTNRLLLPRFIRAAAPDASLPDTQIGMKSLFRPGPVVQIGPHWPQLDQTYIIGPQRAVWRNGSGQDITDALMENDRVLAAQTRDTTLAQINHYALRSNAVFALHHLADPPLTGDPYPMTPADYGTRNTNHVVDDTITRWAQATTAEIQRLQSFPGVQAAHKDTVTAFQDLIAQMRATAAPDSIITQLCDPETTKRTMAQQVAGHAKASTSPKSAGDMQMVDPEDLAPDWLADLRRSGHRRGWYYGDDTFAVQMTTRSPHTLVVSFDDLPDVSNTSLARTTSGYPFYRDEGWSHMGVMAFTPHWFRDPRLFNFLEGQVKAGLFERYARVVLTGTGMGGYAATTFASLVPGCTVLAFAPQSTLNPSLVPWETRFEAARACDWSGRYRDATTQCAGAGNVYIIYDPYSPPDTRHAMRYQGANIVHLKSWYAAHTSANFAWKADISRDIMRAIVAGRLTPARYYQMYRARRAFTWYYNGLTDHMLNKGHTDMAAKLARYLRTQNRSSAAKDIEKQDLIYANYPDCPA